MRKTKILFVLLTALVAAALFLRQDFEKKLSDSYLQFQLASLLSIEIDSLQRWKHEGGFKNGLSTGQANRDVALLQQMLRNIPDVYPEGKITGFYGDLTQKAVREFQKRYGLEPNGLVDEATRQKLNELFFNTLCPKPDQNYFDSGLSNINLSGVAQDYAPQNLVDISNSARTVGISCLRFEAVPFLKKMFAAAQDQGLEIAVSSGFRSSKLQEKLYQHWLSINGSKTLDEVAPPQFSEHQLGTAVDLTGRSVNFRSTPLDFERTPEGKWLLEQSFKYGFVLSYPEGKQDVTGYEFEPWHFRFVGLDVAREIFNQKTTLVEYLRSHPQTIRSPVSPFDDVSQDVANALQGKTFYYKWDRDLEFGMQRDADVAALQKALSFEGIYSADATGDFFESTREAVKLFQQKHDFEVVPESGYVGPYTRQVLNELYAK